MPETQLSNPRKRQRTEPHLPSPPPAKRQKKLPHRSQGYIDTPAFWDSLSKIWLTEHALREFHRRNSRPRSPCRQTRRPTTRNFLAQQRNVRRRTCAADFLRNSVPEPLKGVKRLARHGGPDLSDLVGPAKFVSESWLVYFEDQNHKKNYNWEIYKREKQKQ
ncbi:MAG: hypothetical protein LQ340_001584 [Diploschistes diacapsis]|nr:MAG: hypothetical protein LQ340_001584 [Diploschistes diacapsis]